MSWVMEIIFLSFVNFPWAFWRALAFPLHGECSLTLLVSQFRESEILIQVGYGRGKPDLSFGASWRVFFLDGRLLQFVTHLSSHYLNSHFHISMFFYEGALVWMVVAPHWVPLIPNNGLMIHGSIIYIPYYL